MNDQIAKLRNRSHFSEKGENALNEKQSKKQNIIKVLFRISNLKWGIMGSHLS